MKIHLMSDLHLEMHRDSGREFLAQLDPADSDVCILAGDICAGDSIGKVLRRFSQKYPEVVYVPGNHEYYGTSPGSVRRRLELADTKYPNVHWLFPRREILLGGRRWLGATMWFRGGFNPALKGLLADFRAIGHFEPWVYEENAIWLSWYAAAGRYGDIVVTHHLPAWGSVHPRHAKSPLNPFFVCDVEDAIRFNRPALWMHGHSHDPVDWKLGETRVVSNPFGYPGEVAANWRPKLIEV